MSEVWGDADSVASLSYWLQNYEPRYWYFDCLEMVKKYVLSDIIAAVVVGLWWMVMW